MLSSKIMPLMLSRNNDVKDRIYLTKVVVHQPPGKKITPLLIERGIFITILFN